jgi:Raf kinase inhibitor-like YbhB/YbcL family protein
MALTVSSDSFKEGEHLGNEFVLSAEYGFGCDGGNKSPHLRWTGAPADTKSFAVTCYDPDAPTGSGFWHWLVVNIPPNVNELALGAGNPGGALPGEALQTRTDIGQPGYIGPCSPPGHGDHHYHFTVFALSQDKLQVQADTSAAIVGFQMHFCTLEKATLTGLYKR